MAERGGTSGTWWQRFTALPNNSARKTIIVTLTVALVCSVLVAGSAVLLKPLQIENKETARRSHIAALSHILEERYGSQIPITLEVRLIDLASGVVVTNVDPVSYDQRRAAADPARQVMVPADQDLAGLKTRAPWAVIYIARRAGRLEMVMLPVRGRGFGSMLYGYLALGADLEHVLGLSFHEHGETPGLGALIDSQDWKRRWRGKIIRDGGIIKLGVAPGPVDPSSELARYQVDALTGATWTGMGVTNLLHYWLGPHGFGPYLAKLREGV
ncbi:MAG: NADH:ubiquinone reductase (Na(+)-transporting) subunit C [Alphaproteobacteria bacterium]|nr:NADH:ubiquinone reductase (Na(+)-transporting) subunit C [Alphaproteobacteria bacterium]MBL6954325.1 NADH:ubiquinone reductase (Na(+)-transporting) subunit C [Alphaproteobacteria bacterium]